jgi:hypothetical protein
MRTFVQVTREHASRAQIAPVDLDQFEFALSVMRCSWQQERVMDFASVVVLGLVVSVFIIFALTLMYGDFQSSRRAND